MTSQADRIRHRKSRALDKRMSAVTLLPKLGRIGAIDAVLETKAEAREAARTEVARRARRRYVDRYVERGSINQMQAEAARALFATWVALEPSVPSSWPRDEPRSVPGSRSLYRDIDFEELPSIIAAVGLELWLVLKWVVIDDKSAESWALHADKPNSDGIAALRLALDALVRHYG